LAHPNHLVPRTTWVRNPQQNVFDVNAYYNVLRNEVLLPNALLQDPFVCPEKSAAYNFANIGTILGHEMMHAFDEEGLLYDETGTHYTHPPFWKKESEKNRFQSMQRAIQEVYEKAARREGVYVQHDRTLCENIADIGGFLLAEACLEEYMDMHSFSDKERNESWDDFYKSYAKKWRSMVKPAWLHELEAVDVHSLSRFRVNCVLSFSARFQERIGAPPPLPYPFF
jgi:putative endopeptidase